MTSHAPVFPHDEPEVVVTLVHGTFARRARWTRRDGTFAHRLEKGLPGVRIITRPVGWSGWNTAWSRTRAATAVAGELERRVAEWPRSRHFVLGHSHGGAVALLAVSCCNEHVKTSISGIATIATPFIVVRPLALLHAGMIDTVRRIWLVILSAASVYPVFVLTAQAESYGKGSGIPIFITLATVAIVGSHSTSARLGRTLVRYAQHSCRLLGGRVPDDVEVLILRATGDEASALLSVFQLAARCLRTTARGLLAIFTPITATMRLSERLGRWVPGVLSFAGASLLLAIIGLVTLGPALSAIGNAAMDILAPGTAGPATPVAPHSLRGDLADYLTQLIRAFPSETFCTQLTILAISGTILASGAFLAIAAVLSILLAVSGTVLLPFGPEALLAPLLAEVSVESVPLGTWTVRLVTNRRPGLAHSAYDEPRTARALAAWMRGQLTRQPNTPAANRPLDPPTPERGQEE